MEEDAVELLAKRGHAARGQSAAAEQAKTDRAAEREAAHRMRVAKRSVSPFGWMWLTGWGRLTLLYLTLIVAGPWAYSVPASRLWLTLALALVVLGGSVAWAHSNLAYRAEKVWLSALPFRAPTYWTTLGNDRGPRITGTYVKGSGEDVRFKIRFRDALTDVERVIDVIAAFDIKAKVELPANRELAAAKRELINIRYHEGLERAELVHANHAGQRQHGAALEALQEKETRSTAEVSRLEGLGTVVSIVKPALCWSAGSNRELFQYFHQLVNDVCLPLHGRHSIDEVFVAFTSDTSSSDA